MDETTATIGYPQAYRATTIDAVDNAQHFILWMALLVVIPVCWVMFWRCHESCCFVKAFRD